MPIKDSKLLLTLRLLQRDERARERERERDRRTDGQIDRQSGRGEGGMKEDDEGGRRATEGEGQVTSELTPDSPVFLFYAFLNGMSEIFILAIN